MIKSLHDTLLVHIRYRFVRLQRWSRPNWCVVARRPGHSARRDCHSRRDEQLLPWQSVSFSKLGMVVFCCMLFLLCLANLSFPVLLPTFAPDIAPSHRPSLTPHGPEVTVAMPPWSYRLPTPSMKCGYSMVQFLLVYRIQLLYGELYDCMVEWSDSWQGTLTKLHGCPMYCSTSPNTQTP